MTDIWLVRHGEAAASWGEHADPGLSDLGHQQARAVGEALERLVPRSVQILSSPKARALETAKPLAETLSRDIDISEAFVEITAPVPLAERQTWLRGFMTQSWPEQADSLWRWRKGIIDALLEIQRPTVIFSHFLVINTVMAHISRQHATVQLLPDNGSHHQFRSGDGRLEVVQLGRELDTLVN